jgi:hypothetical protein
MALHISELWYIPMRVLIRTPAGAVASRGDCRRRG